MLGEWGDGVAMSKHVFSPSDCGEWVGRGDVLFFLWGGGGGEEVGMQRQVMEDMLGFSLTATHSRKQTVYSLGWTPQQDRYWSKSWRWRCGQCPVVSTLGLGTRGCECRSRLTGHNTHSWFDACDLIVRVVLRLADRCLRTVVHDWHNYRFRSHGAWCQYILSLDFRVGLIAVWFERA